MSAGKTYTFSEAPPSLNHAFPTGRNGRRYTSKEYKSWQALAAVQLNIQGIEPVTGPYTLDIEVGRKSSRADIDNLIKPLADLLVKAGATPDDRKMGALSIRRVDGTGVKVTVGEIA